MIAFLAPEPSKVITMTPEEQRRKYILYSILAYSAVFSVISPSIG